MSKLVTSKVSISLLLFSPDPQDTFRSMHLIGVDDCPAMIQWKMSCTVVNSARLRPISMKVFLIIKFSEAPLLIKVLATLCHPIGISMMKGRFLSDNSMSRWSSDLNEISTSDHLILLPGSICWARLISRWSFFPYILEVMDMLPPKMSLISAICSSPSGSTRC
jgi:hypothetical protein